MSSAHIRTALCLAVVAAVTAAAPALSSEQSPGSTGHVGDSLHPAEAQAAAPAELGDFFVPLRSLRARVVVAATPKRPLVGRLHGMRGDTLTITSGKRDVAVPLRDTRRIDIGRGVGRSAGRGALIGLVAGGALGAVGGAVEEYQGPQYGGRAAQVIGGAAAGAVLGLCVGTFVGNAIPRTKWEPLPLTRVGVDAAGDMWIPAPTSLPVRVTAPHWKKGPRSGMAVARAGDSLRFVSRGEEIWIPTMSITKVEVAWTQRGWGDLGALIGFGCGFAAGALEAKVDVVQSGLVGGLIGSVVGTLVGGGTKTWQWREVPMAAPPLELRSQTNGQVSPGAVEPAPSAAGDSLGIER